MVFTEQAGDPRATAARKAVGVVGDILGRAHDWDMFSVQDGEHPGSWNVVIDAGEWVASLVVQATVVDVGLRDDKI